MPTSLTSQKGMCGRKLQEGEWERVKSSVASSGPCCPSATTLTAPPPSVSVLWPSTFPNKWLLMSSPF